MKSFATVTTVLSLTLAPSQVTAARPGSFAAQPTHGD
jgi:hypothetical protein